MGIDASAVARGTGISVEYVDLSGGNARFLPQRLAIFAQGQSGLSYATEKFQVTGGSKEVGSKLGYNSPAYLMARELFPLTGGGVGSIPVDVIPLAEASGATAAEGDITPSAASGVSKAATYFAIIGGVRSLPFVVPKIVGAAAATDISDILESLRQAIEGKLGMPATVLHEYGSPTDTPDGGNTGDGALTVAVDAGGTPKAGTWTLTCTEAVTDASVFELVDPNGFSVGTVTEGGGETTLAGLDLTLADGSVDFAEGDSFSIEVPSTALNVISGWKGSSANDITIQIDGPQLGVTWALTQPTGGAANPTVDAALQQIGDVWTTMIINALEIADTTALDAYQVWGGNPDDETGRWAPLVRKPAVVFTGNNAPTVNGATSVTSGRGSDNVNAQLVAPGSPNLPCVIAAAQVSRIAVLANNNPPHDYGSQRVQTLTPGTDAQQWDYSQQDIAIKRGSSTIKVKDGVVNLADVVTMYAPEGEEPPAYRFVCDIVKLQNVIYNIDLEFSGSNWDGKPLIADGQATVNPEARTPSSAKTAMFARLDGLALGAIITDPAAAKAATVAVINGANPKRLDITTVVKLAGNTNIKDINLKFGFQFGSSS